MSLQSTIELQLRIRAVYIEYRSQYVLNCRILKLEPPRMVRDMMGIIPLGIMYSQTRFCWLDENGNCLTHALRSIAQAI